MKYFYELAVKNNFTVTRAYLQNKKAKYYYLTDEGRVALTDIKTALHTLPEILEPVSEPGAIQQVAVQTRFAFRQDGCRILSYLFFTMGNDADCILTLKEGDDICGNLDFSTARIYGRREIRIICMHF